MKSLRLLLINDEWYSRKGGISTFNREFCIALAKAGHDVTCYLPSASAQEVSHASDHKVRLVTAADIPGLKSCCRLCLKPSLDLDPEVIIGHDQITGSAIHALGDQFFPLAKKVFVVHTAPDEIEWHKKKEGSSTRAEQRVRAQVECARAAHLIVTVGPRLFRKFESAIFGAKPNHPQLHRLDPGFKRDLGEKRVLTEKQIFLLGRAEDFELKGIDLAMKAFAKYRDNLHEHQKDASVLVIRGAERGKGHELKAKLLQVVTGVPESSIRIMEYSENEEDLLSHMRQASVLLMPSRVEGFGLVGLEAIGAAIPVLVDASSGLAELLHEKLDSLSDSMIVGKSDSDDEAALAWATRITSVLQDRTASNFIAGVMCEKLAQVLNWETAVKSFEEALSTLLSDKPESS